MSHKPLQIGVIGMGSRGRYFAKCWPAHPDCEVRAVCETDRRVWDVWQGEAPQPAPDRHEDMHELLARDDIDAVVVATNDKTHRVVGQAVLEAGKHLFLEKPMAQTIEDCDALIECWKNNPTVFMIGLELRYCTLCQTMRKILDRGDIGEVRLGYAVDNVSVGGRYYFHGPRRRKDYITSLVLEKGTHTLDLMNWFIGSEPTRVYAEGGLDVFGGDAPNDLRCPQCDRRETCPHAVGETTVSDYGQEVRMVDRDYCVWAEEVDVEDNSILTVRYANGAKMTYVECHFTPDYNRHFTLIGTKGRMEAFYNNEQDFRIELTYRHCDRRDVIDPGKQPGGHGGGDPAIQAEFLRRVRAATPCCPGVLGARNAAAIAIAATHASETHQPQNIPPAPLHPDDATR